MYITSKAVYDLLAEKKILCVLVIEDRRLTNLGSPIAECDPTVPQFLSARAAAAQVIHLPLGDLTSDLFRIKSKEGRAILLQVESDECGLWMSAQCPQLKANL